MGKKGDDRRTKWKGESLEDAEFDDVDLSRAKFHDAKLASARFDDVNLSATKLTNVSFEKADIDDASLKRDAASVGTQVDFRFTLLSRLPMTLSFGYAVGSEKDGERNGEFLYSLKILGEE